MLIGPVGRDRASCSLVPFLSGTGEKSARRRPIAVLSVILIMLTLSVLTYLGTFTPWSPVMDAWSGAPTPVEYREGPLAARAAGRARSCRPSSAATATASAARAACAARRSTTSRRGSRATS